MVGLAINYASLFNIICVNLGVLMKYALLIVLFIFRHTEAQGDDKVSWQMIDDFESSSLSGLWQLVDSDNQTSPHVPNPQVTKVRVDEGNSYLLKKPANEGVVGNRKALTFRQLPSTVEVGETYTFYTRIQVEYFPNNHSFGLSNLKDEGIIDKNYDAFEPMIRVTDKAESDGSVNNGTLMVSTGFKTYDRISNAKTKQAAKPMEKGVWYELWYVVNNASYADGGQRFDLFMRGGEFKHQTQVFKGAVFRMQREKPLRQFFMISNTGSKKKPYGNGGLLYDDLYMVKGKQLTDPRTIKL